MNNIELKKELTDKQLNLVLTKMLRNQKSVIIAYILWWFLAGFGAHQFYLRRPVKALLILLPIILSILFVTSSFVLTTWKAANGVADFLKNIISDPTGGALLVVSILTVIILCLISFFIIIFDLFTLSRQVAKANGKIERGIIERVVSASSEEEKSSPVEKVL